MANHLKFFFRSDIYDMKFFIGIHGNKDSGIHPLYQKNWQKSFLNFLHAIVWLHINRVLYTVQYTHSYTQHLVWDGYFLETRTLYILGIVTYHLKKVYK